MVVRTVQGKFVKAPVGSSLTKKSDQLKETQQF